jgi:hypothetical protein
MVLFRRGSTLDPFGFRKITSPDDRMSNNASKEMEGSWTCRRVSFHHLRDGPADDKNPATFREPLVKSYGIYGPLS